jgi:transposase
VGPAPAVSKTTPFSPGIHALAIYFERFQLMSYERLLGMFGTVLGLSVSEGVLMNMFIRSHPAFEIEADKALAILRQAKVVASDYTGVRIEGTNAFTGCSPSRAPWFTGPTTPARGGWRRRRWAVTHPTSDFRIAM